MQIDKGIREEIKMKLANIEGGQASNWYPWYKIDEDYPNWEEDAIEALYDGRMQEHIKLKLTYLVTIINKNLGKELS